MIISLIAAVDSNWTIGNKGKLPWGKIKTDLRHFREKTIGKPVIVGQKTFDSLGKPLPQRFNIIVTNRQDFSVNHDNCVVVNSVAEALTKAQEQNAEEVMGIGGAKIYELFLPLADRLYLTFILGIFNGDTRFPKFEFGEGKEWEENINKRMFAEDAETKLSLCFSVFERNRPKTRI